ncbi:serine/threonine-protein kinase [Streptomyces sp. NEAU-YJ-81]|uniref:serine/threonine-protein kinase n=1 Tax=Streptomyces sp. NEAU-YJ-81 TaxID=2820288 RepID=UPI001ABCAD13|nr:serine/threonine-protein kinase [Streptomyces sp. NEAU-YJ-81]MBO3674337.1 serine/threonine protein kinase [Streptomyces sp. NEAU-YJ-81]
MGTGGEGRLIANRYRLATRLGRGGMGTVWRAVDELLGRDVAVKELHVDEGLTAFDSQLRGERTLREARTVAQIKHPNVIVLHDVIEEDECAWIVMELVDGLSLADRLGTHGPVGPREAGRIAAVLLDALRAAHARGVLHRDIKPANVLVESGTGRVVLTDFGIAQVTGSTTITETGSFVGSPEYTAPERMSGRRTGPESDLWSLGVLICTLVGGESPFHRESLAAVLHAVVFDEIPVPEAAGPLKPVIEGLLRRDPEERLSGDEVERMLRMAQEVGDTPEIPLEYTPTQPSVPIGPDGRGSSAFVPAPVPVPAPAPAAAPASASASVPASAPAAWSRSGRGARRRAVLTAAAAVVALAGVAAGVVALLDDGGGEGGTAKGGGTSQSADKGGSRSPSAPEKAPQRPVKDADSTAGPEARIPDGYELVKDPLGFSLAVPEGFAREYKAPRVYYNSPGMEFRIGIHVQEQSAEGPLGLSRKADAKGPQDYPGYRSGQVIETEHNGRPAALWAFIWNGSADDGGSRQTYDLSWNENGKMYDLWLSAPVGEKSVGKQHFDTAAATFSRPGTAN